MESRGACGANRDVLSAARWTSDQLKTFRSGRLDAEAKRRPKVKRSEKIDPFLQVCKVFGLPEPHREYKFHPTRRWRIDYLFEHNGRRVALEVEGGVWRGGRHTNPAGFMKDMDKYNAISAAGIVLLRTTPGELMKTETIELVKRTLYQ